MLKLGILPKRLFPDKQQQRCVNPQPSTFKLCYNKTSSLYIFTFGVKEASLSRSTLRTWPSVEASLSDGSRVWGCMNEDTRDSFHEVIM